MVLAQRSPCWFLLGNAACRISLSSLRGEILLSGKSSDCYLLLSGVTQEVFAGDIGFCWGMLHVVSLSRLRGKSS